MILPPTLIPTTNPPPSPPVMPRWRGPRRLPPLPASPPLWDPHDHRLTPLGHHIPPPAPLQTPSPVPETGPGVDPFQQLWDLVPTPSPEAMPDPLARLWTELENIPELAEDDPLLNILDDLDQLMPIEGPVLRIPSPAHPIPWPRLPIDSEADPPPPPPVPPEDWNQDSDDLASDSEPDDSGFDQPAPAQAFAGFSCDHVRLTTIDVSFQKPLLKLATISAEPSNAVFSSRPTAPLSAIASHCASSAKILSWIR